jgi:hypothetical protein
MRSPTIDSTERVLALGSFDRTVHWNLVEGPKCQTALAPIWSKLVTIAVWTRYRSAARLLL